MKFFIDNWYLFVAAIAALGAIGIVIYRFFGLPTDKQLSKVREWLLYAVTKAEAELGGGTGKLKLRQVYDMFLSKFPWLVKVISFELFSEMVDDALEEMRKMLAENKAVKALVEGGDIHE